MPAWLSLHEKFLDAAVTTGGHLKGSIYLVDRFIGYLNEKFLSMNVTKGAMETGGVMTALMDGLTVEYVGDGIEAGLVFANFTALGLFRINIIEIITIKIITTVRYFFILYVLFNYIIIHIILLLLLRAIPRFAGRPG